MQSKLDYGAMNALVALSNAQLGRTIWHFLREQGIGGGRLVTSARDAVARMEQARFSLFFVDYELPEFGGVDFIKFIRMCNGPVAEAFVVMVIPTPDKQKVVSARDAGAHEILGLPLTAKLLHSRMNHMIGNPKPFIRAPSYIGPCRRREVVKIHHGVERRSSPRPRRSA
ncbi:response regulator [Kordiimonas sp.]|uniref:response regulator n=1 Tax=Kordiimonas sp. TaxID=1970157 RepID=UPI003A951BAD